MILVVNFQQIIKNYEEDISYLVATEGFDRKEAIKFVLTITSLSEISHKLDD